MKEKPVRGQIGMDLLPLRQVVPGGDGEGERHACRELRRFFFKATGRRLRWQRKSGGPCLPSSLVLGSQDMDIEAVVRELASVRTGFTTDDDFVIRRIDPCGLWLCGASVRALHYAVYALLNRMGCHWPSVGREWEILPDVPVRNIPDPATRETPRFRIRGIDPVDMIAYYTPAALVAHLDWMARNRMNLFYFMLRTEREYVLRHLLPLAAREAALRGIDVAVPVNACDVIPYDLLSARPELFSFSKTRPLNPHFQPVAVKGGYRTASQLCVTNPALRQVYAQRLNALLDRLPEGVGIISAICNDGSGFCTCPSCRRLAPADHVQTIWNLALETVRARGARVRLSRYAYTSWQEPPARVPVHTEECHHVLYDIFSRNDEIPMDSPHAGSVIRARAGEKRFANVHEQLISVMRDWIRLDVPVAPWHNSMKMYRRGTAAGLARVFERDFDLYEQAGAAGGIFEAYILYWHGFAPNFFAASRMLWRGADSAAACLDDFCNLSFGPAAAPMRAYLRWLEQTTQRGGTVRPHMIMDRITDCGMARVRGYFEKARAAAGGKRRWLRRIGDLRDHFEYLCAWRAERGTERRASRRLRAGRWKEAALAWRALLRANEQTARAAERIERRFALYGWKWPQAHRARVQGYLERLKQTLRACAWSRPLEPGRHALNPALFDTPHLGPFGNIMTRGARLASAAGGKGRDELGLFLPLVRAGLSCRLRMTGGNVVPCYDQREGRKPKIEIRVNGHRVHMGPSGLPNIPIDERSGQPCASNGTWCVDLPADRVKPRNTIVIRLLDPVSGYSTHFEDMAVDIRA